MNVLLLTYYFAPDLSAGSFRNTPLAHELARQVGDRGTVHVVTTQPNRYASFRAKAPATEQHGNLRIDRIEVPPHDSSFAGQIRTYAHYVWRAWWLTRRQPYDVVVASSSRLFSGFLGACLARHKGIPLVLDIRDLFRDTILEVKNDWKSPALRLVLGWIERFTFGTARHINLVSAGFRPYFVPYRQATYSEYTNGIDELFLDVPRTPPPDASAVRPRVILYAGNIGEGQGLEKIIPPAAQQLGPAYQFVVIGDGNTRHKLLRAVADRHLTNVAIRPPVARHVLLAAYAGADYLLMHLNDLRSVERCIPSKLFEYGATDKPILAGVAGYGAEFVRRYVPNSLLFAPGDAAALVRLVASTPYRTEVRTAFIGRFRRDTLIQALARQVLLATTDLPTPKATTPA